MKELVLVASFLGAPAPPSERPNGDTPPHSRWQSAADSSEFLVLVRYADPRAANDDLREVVDSVETIPLDINLPSEVHHVSIDHTDGIVLEQVPVGGSMTVVRTVASPGYGHEAGERTEELVSTFAQLNGYCGHLQGLNDAVQEESWALLFTENSNDVPLPDSAGTSVRMYRRVD